MENHPLLFKGVYSKLSARCTPQESDNIYVLLLKYSLHNFNIENYSQLALLLQNIQSGLSLFTKLLLDHFFTLWRYTQKKKLF